MSKFLSTTLFASYVEASDLTQKEIAEAAGYSKQNMISMFKIGEARVPPSKIPVFAKILKFDAKKFLRVVMEEKDPAAWEAIVSIMGFASKHESDLLDRIKGYLGGKPIPAITTPEQEKALRAFCEALREPALAG